MMNAILIPNDNFDLPNLGNQLRRAIFEKKESLSLCCPPDHSLRTTITTDTKVFRDLNQRWPRSLDEIEGDR